MGTFHRRGLPDDYIDSVDIIQHLILTSPFASSLHCFHCVVFQAPQFVSLPSMS